MPVSLWWVMAVPLIIWIGVFAYMMNIDRSLRRLERDRLAPGDQEAKRT